MYDLFKGGAVSYEIAQPLFFALSVPTAVEAVAGQVQDEVRRSIGAPRLPALDDLHVTLAYLGRLDFSIVRVLLGLAEETAARHDRFALRTTGLGGFPRPGGARILWLGFAPQPALDALVADLWATLQAGRIGFDAKPFHPHLTLARFREPVAIERVAFTPPPPLVFVVREFGLFQSVQVQGGTRYRLLGSVPLGGREPML
jgi:RNA 2',3'-cyclic 3'-phosphodiesterase